MGQISRFLILFVFFAFNILSASDTNTSYQIKSGWNLIGTGLSDNELSLNNNQSITDSVKIVWVYDNIEGWKAFSKQQYIIDQLDSYSMINTIAPGTGFWVYSDVNTTIDIMAQIDLVNTFTGSVKTDSSGVITPITEANITIQNENHMYSVLSNSTGTYTFNNIPYGNYLLSVKKDGYIDVNASVMLDSEYEDYAQIRLQQVTSSSVANTYTFQGIVKDAISGSGVSGVTVKVIEGLNNQLGTAIQEVITDSSGNFSFTQVASGSYTVICQKDGYIKNVNNIQLISDTNNDTITQDFTISPYSENIRIVLTWGATPSDLDSHFAKMVGDIREWHVYYSNKYSSGYSSINESNLDTDDRYSYGPETITLSSMDMNATYKYYVHDYSNEMSSSSSDLSNSSAKVTVYIEQNEYVFNVPNYDGTVWKVFEIVNGTIVPCVGSSCVSYDSSYDSDRDQFGLMRILNNSDIDFSSLPNK